MFFLALLRRHMDNSWWHQHGFTPDERRHGRGRGHGGYEHQSKWGRYERGPKKVKSLVYSAKLRSAYFETSVEKEDAVFCGRVPGHAIAVQREGDLGSRDDTTFAQLPAVDRFASDKLVASWTVAVRRQQVDLALDAAYLLLHVDPSSLLQRMLWMYAELCPAQSMSVVWWFWCAVSGEHNYTFTEHDVDVVMRCVHWLCTHGRIMYAPKVPDASAYAERTLEQTMASSLPEARHVCATMFLMAKQWDDHADVAQRLWDLIHRFSIHRKPEVVVLAQHTGDVSWSESISSESALAWLADSKRRVCSPTWNVHHDSIWFSATPEFRSAVLNNVNSVVSSTSENEAMKMNAEALDQYVQFTCLELNPRTPSQLRNIYDILVANPILSETIHYCLYRARCSVYHTPDAVAVDFQTFVSGQYADKCRWLLDRATRKTINDKLHSTTNLDDSPAESVNQPSSRPTFTLPTAASVYAPTPQPYPYPSFFY